LQKWNKQFDADEHGLGDAGFRGLEDNGVLILTPPNEDDGDQMVRKFSSLQVVVEQTIGKIKDWTAAQDTLRHPSANREQLYEWHNKVWTVVSVFLNKYRNKSD